MSRLNKTPYPRTGAVATMKRPTPMPEFRDITLADLPQINRILQMTRSRTCDYSAGGIFMWIDYFKYKYCIYNDTLFIKGVSEADLTTPAFSLPIGAMPVADSIKLLKNYCDACNMTLHFSAIPEDRLADFISVGLTDTRLLEDWSDYLYDIEALASLHGNKLSKKRNHVNRFIADNPGFTFTAMTPDDARKLEVTSSDWIQPDEGSPTADAEHKSVVSVLENLLSYPFEGAMLRDGSGRVVAFSIGEVIGDTLFVHIEKMRHDVAGSGETINKMFASSMLEKYPFLRYVNREEDTGDEGLRKAKLSYHPSLILRKYDITL